MTLSFLRQFEITIHVNCPYKKMVETEALFQQAALDTITLEHGSIVILEIYFILNLRGEGYFNV